MDLAYLKKIVKIVENSTVDEIEIKEEGLHVRISKKGTASPAFVHAATAHPAAPVQAPPVKFETPPPAQAPTPQPETKYIEIKSPIVGTFYRAPAPDADPYVEVGQIVQPKQVLCIVEAMKLMNEIESDVSGRIIKIMVENAQPVEYNQVLFLIEPV
jgi:acetyl-CoA carboxylase biotin carboxyl carrier protein